VLTGAERKIVDGKIVASKSNNSDEGIHCSQYMNFAFLSALFALAGSVIGGLTSGVATWLGLRVQARAGQLALEMSRRDDLYRDYFIVAASKAYGEAILSNEPQIQEPSPSTP